MGAAVGGFMGAGLGALSAPKHTKEAAVDTYNAIRAPDRLGSAVGKKALGIFSRDKTSNLRNSILNGE